MSVSTKTSSNFLPPGHFTYWYMVEPFSSKNIFENRVCSKRMVAHTLIDENWILYLRIYSNNPGRIQSNLNIFFKCDDRKHSCIIIGNWGLLRYHIQRKQDRRSFWLNKRSKSWISSTNRCTEDHGTYISDSLATSLALLEWNQLCYHRYRWSENQSEAIHEHVDEDRHYFHSPVKKPVILIPWTS